MEEHCGTGNLFYMGAQTEWLPAEKFENINNWDDSLKPSASHCITQVEEWIASMDGCEEVKECQFAGDGIPTITNPVAQKDNESASIIPVITTGIVNSCVVVLEKFACSQCGRAFNAKSNLKAHLRIHSGEKPFACSQCGKAFAHKSTLNRHLRIHSGERPFSCSQCGKAFSQNGDLTKHLRIHSGEKPFACSQCGKSFAQTANLTKHLRVHSGEKPFACSQCGKAFSYKSTLKRHALVHIE